MQLELHDRVALDSFSLKMKKGVKDEDVFLRGLLGDLIKTTRVGTIEITPALAAIMLERNTGNRTLSRTRVARYASEMSAGKWELTGEPIIFSKEGVLNDGQTRLAACVEAAVPFRTDVRFGIDRKAFEVTGVGAKRTVSDVFSIMGEKCSTRLAAALSWLHGYEKGDLHNRSISNHEGLRMLENHPDIRKSVEAVSLLYHRTRLMEPSLAAFLHYIFALKDSDKADAFFQFLTDGIGATNPKDPRLLIRERLVVNGASKAKLGPIDIAALTIKAWNNYRSGKIVGTLKWVNKPTSGTPEAFPRAL